MTWLSAVLLAVLAPRPSSIAACADDSPVPESAADTAVTTAVDATTSTTPATSRRRAHRRRGNRRRPTEPTRRRRPSPRSTSRSACSWPCPTQNREDPAKNQFQVQIHNGTDDRYDIDGVQFEWAGFTTPMTDRDSVFVGGQVVDYPVPFPGATCVGDGTRATMPSLDDAKVVLLLDSGETVDVPVVDKWHLARKLYEDDCEKQMIEDAGDDRVGRPARGRVRGSSCDRRRTPPHAPGGRRRVSRSCRSATPSRSCSTPSTPRSANRS